MAFTNRYRGLPSGPLSHDAASVINLISSRTTDMGAPVKLVTTAIPSGELVPRVDTTDVPGTKLYGIAVQGVTDGVYGDGSGSTDDTTRAVNGAGQGIVVVTQGRCLAKVSGASPGPVSIGDNLTNDQFFGVLRKAQPGDFIIAIALHPVSITDTDMIAVDVQRGGNVQT